MTIETASLPLAEGQTENRHAIDDLLSAFEAFKQANDARLAEIEKHHSADVLLEEKVDRMNTQLGRLTAVAQRPAMAADEAAADTDEAAEAKAAFENYIRGQAPNAEQKAAPDNFNMRTHEALVLPDYLEARLNDEMAAASPLTRLATQRVLDNNATVKWVRSTDLPVAKWVDEKVARPKSAANELVTANVRMNELYANPVATQRFIDDAEIDVEAWIIRSLSDAFAAAEADGFFNGNGSHKPLGLLQPPSSYAPTQPTQVKFTKTGAKGAFKSQDPADALLTTMFAVDAIYRKNAAWLFNASVMAELRKMKDKSGAYIWTPASQIGEAPSLFGYPVYEEAQMQDFSPNSLVGAFGDFGRAYMIVRRAHTTLIRDPYSEKPLVQFYATRRVGGHVIDPKAYVVLQAVA